MAIQTFSGTVHHYRLNGRIRTVVDPRTIPAHVRDALCLHRNYQFPSAIGENHHVAHFDIERQDWRDMRYARHEREYPETALEYNTVTDEIFYEGCCAF